MKFSHTLFQYICTTVDPQAFFTLDRYLPSERSRAPWYRKKRRYYESCPRPAPSTAAENHQFLRREAEYGSIKGGYSRVVSRQIIFLILPTLVSWSSARLPCRVPSCSVCVHVWLNEPRVLAKPCRQRRPQAKTPKGRRLLFGLRAWQLSCLYRIFSICAYSATHSHKASRYRDMCVPMICLNSYL